MFFFINFSKLWQKFGPLAQDNFSGLVCYFEILACQHVPSDLCSSSRMQRPDWSSTRSPTPHRLPAGARLPCSRMSSYIQNTVESYNPSPSAALCDCQAACYSVTERGWQPPLNKLPSVCCTGFHSGGTSRNPSIFPS